VLNRVINTDSERITIPAGYRSRGFLPEQDPLCAFPADSPYALLDEVGVSLPGMLEHHGFRERMRSLQIPLWPESRNRKTDLPELRLYYLRIGFIASAYINQLGEPPLHSLPATIAVPLCRVCKTLKRPPILSYDGYALYNWKRLDPAGPIALGNTDTIQNFVPLNDEHWFILVHVEIEALAARILDAVARIQESLAIRDYPAVDTALVQIAEAVEAQTCVLKRIPEKMDHRLYHRTFRKYIRFFEDVHYEGVSQSPISYRGETGAQSSIMPLLVGLMKIRHRPSVLTNHLADMRHYMPAGHRTLIEAVEQLPDLHQWADPVCFNRVLDAMADFREVHYGWAEQYIHRHTDDPRGTGGTPFMQWLRQLIDETYAARLPEHTAV
jgi:indoleamine 2,3-dioxygenase